MPHTGEHVIDRFIRFVAQDSQGRCFLWSMHWGVAGYSCRSARLTPAEVDELHAGSMRTSDDRAPAQGCHPLRIKDRSPRVGSFARSENAMQFFASDDDPALTRWVRAMFDEIIEPPESDD